MLYFIEKCGALDVIEGKLSEPQPLPQNASKEEQTRYDSEISKFTKADSSALLILATNMTEETLQKVMRFTNARDVWLELLRLLNMMDILSCDMIYV